MAFNSDASDLVAGDTNGFQDVFVKNLQTGELRLISVAPDGTQANGYSFVGGFWAHGHFLVFQSNASNLVAGNANRALDSLRQGSVDERNGDS